ncbi:MAG: YqjK-like family protein [Azonexus sp.]|jgi:hypothetical protein|nr:YqjK-like family protein [Azonexus sp.]
MSKRSLKLAERRGALSERIAAQRERLAQHATGIERLCAGGDVALHGVDWLKQHPVTAGLASFAIVLLRPRRAFRWVKRGFFLWRGWRSAHQLLAGKP